MRSTPVTFLKRWIGQVQSVVGLRLAEFPIDHMMFEQLLIGFSITSLRQKDPSQISRLISSCISQWSVRWLNDMFSSHLRA